MRRLVLTALALALLAGAASAALCGKCKGKMFIMSIGKCTLCTNHTSSGSHKLCRACSTKRKECEHCGGPLGAVGPVRPGVPGKGPGASPTPAGALVLDESAHGKTVRVAAGATFYVKLKVDPVLQWSTDPPAGDAVVAVGKPRHLPLLGPDGRPIPTFAPSGHMLYTFRAVKKGVAILNFKLAARRGRPANRNKSFTVTVQVTRAAAPPSEPPAAPGGGLSAEGIAKMHWKGVRSVAPIPAPKASALLGGAKVYCVAVFNPKSVIAGRPTFLHTIVMGKAGNVLIENDEGAASVLSGAKLQVAAPGDALDVAAAFGELRHYPIETRPQQGRRTSKPSPDDWTVTIERADGGWVVSCTFVTDPNITLCRRYAVRIAADGTVKAEAGKTVSIRGGYR